MSQIQSDHPVVTKQKSNEPGIEKNKLRFKGVRNIKSHFKDSPDSSTLPPRLTPRENSTNSPRRAVPSFEKRVESAPDVQLHSKPQSHDLTPLPEPASNSEVSTTNYFYESLERLYFSMGLHDEQINAMFIQLESILEPHQHSILRTNMSLPDEALKTLHGLKTLTKGLLHSQQKLKHVVLLQRVVRMWLVRHNFKSHGDPEDRLRYKLRNEKLNELIRLENNYVRHMERLINEYLIPLRKREMKGITVGNIAQIFSNVEDLHSMHAQMLESLSAVFDNAKHPFFGGIGEVFVKYSNQILPLYENYIAGYQIAVDTLDFLSEEVPRFAAFLEEVRTNALNSNYSASMKEILTLPLQHIAHYESLLSQSLSYSKPTDVGYEALTNAVAIIGKVASVTQTKLDESSRCSKILSVQRRVEVDKPLNLFDNPKRTLIREGPVKIDDKKGYMFAFNDVLLVADRSSASSLKYQKRLSIDKDSRVKPDLKDKGKYFMFSFTSDGVEIVIGVKKPSEKSAWVHELLKLIDTQQKKRIFGAPLQTVLQLEGRENGVPLVFEKTVAAIRKNGFHTEGLFRIPGDTAYMQDLKRIFDTEGGDSLDFDKHSIHDVAGLLKLFFREMPEPIFPFSCFSVLITLQRQLEGNQVDTYNYLLQLAKIIATLSEENKRLLHELCKFLLELIEYQDYTKMNSRNISVVFAPNLIRPRDDTITTALLCPQVIRIFSSILENLEGLWDFVEMQSSVNSLNSAPPPQSAVQNALYHTAPLPSIPHPTLPEPAARAPTATSLNQSLSGSMAKPLLKKEKGFRQKRSPREELSLPASEPNVSAEFKDHSLPDDASPRRRNIAPRPRKMKL